MDKGPEATGVPAPCGDTCERHEEGVITAAVRPLQQISKSQAVSSILQSPVSELLPAPPESSRGALPLPMCRRAWRLDFQGSIMPESRR